MASRARVVVENIANFFQGHYVYRFLLGKLRGILIFLPWYFGWMSGSFLAEFFPEPGPGLSEGRWRKDVTSHFRHKNLGCTLHASCVNSKPKTKTKTKNVTFQVRCDAAKFRKTVFSTSKNATIFLELGTNVTISSHRHIIFLGSAWNNHQFENLATFGFWVPGFPISPWNDPQSKNQVFPLRKVIVSQTVVLYEFLVNFFFWHRPLCGTDFCSIFFLCQVNFFFEELFGDRCIGSWVLSPLHRRLSPKSVVTVDFLC